VFGAIDSDDAVTTAATVQRGNISAVEVVTAALARIEARDRELNCFTVLTAEKPLADAKQIDRAVATKDHPSLVSLCCQKNLFDIAGLTTIAGSKINAEKPASAQDATAVAALKRAGAVLIGTLNMDEYGFVTENTHYGPTHNPHDLTASWWLVRWFSCCGCSWVGAADVRLDTNGSPACLLPCACVFKADLWRLSRAGWHCLPAASTTLDRLPVLAAICHGV